MAEQVTPAVTVGILYYSTPNLQILMDHCVRSIKRSAGIPNIVHVICNGASDKTIEKLKADGLIDRLDYMDLKSVGNPSAQHGFAKNLMVEQCTTRYFFSTEPDVVFFGKDWLKKTLAFASENVKLVGPSFIFDAFGMRIVHPFCMLVETESFKKSASTFAAKGYVFNKYINDPDFIDDSVLVSLKHLLAGYSIYFLGQCARNWQPTSVPVKGIVADFAYFPDTNECFCLHIGRSGKSPEGFNEKTQAILQKLLAPDNPALLISPSGDYGHPKRMEAMNPGLYRPVLSEEQQAFIRYLDTITYGADTAEVWRWNGVHRIAQKKFGTATKESVFQKIRNLFRP